MGIKNIQGNLSIDGELKVNGVQVENVNHDHDDVYSKIDHVHPHNHDSEYAKINHNHDSDYSDLNHNHDTVYSKLSHNHDEDYSDINHTHQADNSKLDKVGGTITGDLVITGKLTVNSAPQDNNDVVRLKELNEAIVGKVDYLGTITAITSLSTTCGKGDFYRVETAFTFGSETAHVGDILIAVKDNPAQNTTDWDLIHTEVNSNTWVANTKTAAGYVSKGTGQSNKVWGTDADGNPNWRELAQIARTGNVLDLVQYEDTVLIFDGGGAADYFDN